MNPFDILNQLNAALIATTTEFFSHMDFGSGDHQEQPPSVPVQVPAMPTPFAGELSSNFIQRWPVSEHVPACSIPAGLKWDPWQITGTEDVFWRGAWKPLEAAFTQPVG